MTNTPILNATDIWEPIATGSQHLLFDPDFIRQAGEHFRQQYAGGSSLLDQEWSTIPLSACRFPQAKNLPTTCVGYDLPITFTPEEWNGRFVAIASQDPLRNPRNGGDRFSLATPWGFSDPKAIRKASNGKIWPVIESLTSHGFGVYLTDAAKLYFHRSNDQKTVETRKLEADTFSLESELVNPELWLAFGRAAERAIRAQGVSSYAYHPHPTAWGNVVRKHYQTDDVSHANVAKLITNDLLSCLGARSRATRSCSVSGCRRTQWQRRRGRQRNATCFWQSAAALRSIPPLRFR